MRRRAVALAMTAALLLMPGAVRAGTSPLGDPPNAGDVIYARDHTNTGADVMTYRVCDRGTPGLCDTASVTITVAAPAPAPTIDPDGMPETDTEGPSGEGSVSVLVLLALGTSAVFILVAAYDARRRDDGPWS